MLHVSPRTNYFSKAKMFFGTLLNMIQRYEQYDVSTSFDPHILSELGGHANKEIFSLFILHFVQVVTSAA